MKRAEYGENAGCPQRDSTECEGYAGARSVVRPESRETAGRAPELLERILNRDNLNRAYKCRRGNWFTVETEAAKRAISNERLARAGFFDLSLAYESIHSACVGRAVYRTVCTVR